MKQIVERAEGGLVKQQHFCVEWSEQDLMDDSTVEECGVVDNCRVYLVKRGKIVTLLSVRSVVCVLNGSFVGGYECKFGSLQPKHGSDIHAFDTNGVLVFIGTKGGTCEYRSGEVLATVSSNSGSITEEEAGMRFVMNRENPGTSLHARKANNCNLTEDKPGQWMSVDLGANFSLMPNHYCLRHGTGGRYRLRSWRLEASHDGTNWATLKDHKNDRRLPNMGFGVADWPIEGVAEAYRHFRVLVTGPNSDGTHALACAGIELYGEFQGEFDAD
jgi:hypothetical protein